MLSIKITDQPKHMPVENEKPVWWVNQRNYRVRTLDIKPYYKDVHSNNDMLSNMASLSQTLRVKNRPLTPETQPNELRW